MPSRPHSRFTLRAHAWRAGAIAAALLFFAACAGSVEDRLAEIHALQDAGQFGESIAPLRRIARRESRAGRSELPARRRAGADRTALTRGVAAREGEFRSHSGGDCGAAAGIDLSRAPVARRRGARRDEGARTGSLPRRRTEGSRAGAARRQSARGSAEGHHPPARTRARRLFRAADARDDPRRARSDRRGREGARRPRGARLPGVETRASRSAVVSRAPRSSRTPSRTTRAAEAQFKTLHREGCRPTRSHCAWSRSSTTSSNAATTPPRSGRRRSRKRRRIRRSALHSPAATSRMASRTRRARCSKEGVELFGNAQAYTQLGEFERRNGQPDKALAAIEEAIKASPKANDNLSFLKADLLIDLGRLDEAETLVNTLAEASFRDLLRGRILLARGDAKGALATFDTGLKRWPNNAGGRYLAGLAAYQVGDFARAESEFREALRVDASRDRRGVLRSPTSISPRAGTRKPPTRRATSSPSAAAAAQTASCSSSAQPPHSTTTTPRAAPPRHSRRRASRSRPPSRLRRSSWPPPAPTPHCVRRRRAMSISASRERSRCCDPIADRLIADGRMREANDVVRRRSRSIPTRRRSTRSRDSCSSGSIATTRHACRSRSRSNSTRNTAAPGRTRGARRAPATSRARSRSSTRRRRPTPNDSGTRPMRPRSSCSGPAIGALPGSASHEIVKRDAGHAGARNDLAWLLAQPPEPGPRPRARARRGSASHRRQSRDRRHARLGVPAARSDGTVGGTVPGCARETPGVAVDPLPPRRCARDARANASARSKRCARRWRPVRSPRPTTPRAKSPASKNSEKPPVSSRIARRSQRVRRSASPSRSARAPRRSRTSRITSSARTSSSRRDEARRRCSSCAARCRSTPRAPRPTTASPSCSRRTISPPTPSSSSARRRASTRRAPMRRSPKPN